jgi:hypothetical protein
MRKRMPKLLVIGAIAACIFGLLLAAPKVAPTASADTLGNGATVNCTQDTDFHATCIVTGCPRVGDDYVPQSIHYMLNGGDQVEEDYSCGGGYRIGVDNNGAPINIGVQLGRKHPTGSDDFTPYANYTFNPPAKAQAPAAVQPTNCPPGSKTPSVIPPAQCEAAPPTTCPDGSVTPEVPSGQQCQPPSNAITMSITNGAPNADITITNSSGLPVSCAYTANKTSGPFTPGNAQYTLNIGVGSHGSNTNSDLLYPVLGATYNAKVTCTGTWDGKQVVVGEKTQSVP